MSGETTLREFLVKLGFEVNKQKEFESAVVGTTVKVVALGAAAAATATAVVASVAAMADGLEKLYFASKRTNSTVDNLQAVGFTAEQMGSSASAALGVVENLARMLRNSPGAEGLLKNIGIQTRGAGGALRDTVDMLGDLGDRFARMPFYKANAYAQALGIDEKTLMAMREGMGQFSEEYKNTIRAVGADSQDAARKSHDFMVQLRSVTALAGLAVQNVVAALASRLTPALQRWRESSIVNFGKIVKAATDILLVVVKIGDAIGIMVVRGAQVIGYLVDRFNGLSEGSQTIIKWLGLILVAWRALSAGFLATPLGRVFALITAIGLLWDDYQTWKEGGKSLIDWAAWAPGIEKAIDMITKLGGAFHDALGFLGDWRPAFEILLAYVTGSWLVGMLGAITKVGAGIAGVGVSAVAKVVPVVAAGAAGYAAGSVLYDKVIGGTKLGDTIGEGLTQILAAFGNKDAQEALDLNARSGISAGAPARRSAPAAAPTGPRGIRNNNPGNIEYGAFARSQGSTGAEAQGRFALFADAQQGLNALGNLLRSYGDRGINSIQAIISRYAPPTDKNNTAAYIASVAKKMGVDAGQPLNLRDPETLQGIINAVVQVENGKNPYSAEMVGKAAGKQVEMHQTTTITLNGGGRDVVPALERSQNSVNERLVRNMRGAAE